tara:strand:- start:100 stop:294 length:195 start_codon:yes stop_codon:yes gene_type:complete
MIILIKEEKNMNSNHVEKLRKDISEAQYYQRRLKEKGKKVLSYKMEKRILEMNHHFNDMKRIEI